MDRVPAFSKTVLAVSLRLQLTRAAISALPDTRKSHHAARNAKLRLNLSNFSERNSCYKHQIYTDSHIAGEPEFCPLVLLPLAGGAHVTHRSANRRLPRSIIMGLLVRARVCDARQRQPFALCAARSCWVNGDANNVPINGVACFPLLSFTHSPFFPNIY